jgi:hypothetical protein
MASRPVPIAAAYAMGVLTVAVFVAVCVICYLQLTARISDDQAKTELANRGYTEVVLMEDVGAQLFRTGDNARCSKGKDVFRGYTAKNIDGRSVRGVVCATWLHGGYEVNDYRVTR